MSQEHIVYAGSSANPPHLGHEALVEALLADKRFAKVIWCPCGIRPDKSGFVPPEHRRAMTERAFSTERFRRYGDKLEIWYSDLEGGEYTPTITQLEALQKQYPNATISWATGSDVLVPAEKYNGLSQVHAFWYRGLELWNNWSCVMFTRKGEQDIAAEQLPPNTVCVDADLPEVSSSHIRRALASGLVPQHLLSPAIAQYIRTHELYIG